MSHNPLQANVSSLYTRRHTHNSLLSGNYHQFPNRMIVGWLRTIGTIKNGKTMEGVKERIKRTFSNALYLSVITQIYRTDANNGNVQQQHTVNLKSGLPNNLPKEKNDRYPRQASQSMIGNNILRGFKLKNVMFTKFSRH